MTEALDALGGEATVFPIIILDNHDHPAIEHRAVFVALIRKELSAAELTGMSRVGSSCQTRKTLVCRT